MSSSRATGRRGNFNSWGRLKPVTINELEQYGLASKGDKRLLDHKLQEQFYAKIVESYMKFCGTSGDDLSQQFAAVSLSNNGNKPPSQSQNQLSAIMTAIRSLREGIVASGRHDSFAQQVYMFTIRAAILTKSMEAYHPALLHLLRVLHMKLPLQKSDLVEFAAYLVLDLACRQRNYAGAFAARRQYALEDAKIDAVLSSLVHDNYNLFWRTKRSVDQYRARLMDAADAEMRSLALKCLGRTYFTVDLDFLKRATQSNWRELQDTYKVGWELSGSTVIIRKPKSA